MQVHVRPSLSRYPGRPGGPGFAAPRSADGPGFRRDELSPEPACGSRRLSAGVGVRHRPCGWTGRVPQATPWASGWLHAPSSDRIGTVASKAGAGEPDSSYAWWRLAASLAASTIGGVGLWSAVVVLPAIQAEFGVDRGGASLPYTATMVGFAIGGMLMGRLADRSASACRC